VNGLGVAQALVCLYVWIMVMYAAEMGHMVPKMPLNIVEECLQAVATWWHCPAQVMML
jgi:hypothetical protein